MVYLFGAHLAARYTGNLTSTLFKRCLSSQGGAPFSERFIRMANWTTPDFGFPRRMRPGTIGLLGLALAVAAGSPGTDRGRTAAATTTQAADPAQSVGLRHADLTRRITSLSQKYPRRVKPGVIGKSARGRDIPLIEIRGENAE